MLAALARRQGAPVPAPPGVINLQKAITHMQEATPEQIDENLTGLYTAMLGENGPATVTAVYADIGADLRAKGNPDRTGPLFLLCNTGQGQLRILSCLIERPASIPDMPADSPFAQAPYIAVLGNKATPE